MHGEWYTIRIFGVQWVSGWGIHSPLIYDQGFRIESLSCLISRAVKEGFQSDCKTRGRSREEDVYHSFIIC